VTPAEQSLVDTAAQVRGGPAWLDEARAGALAAFQRAGLPTPRHEDWRFTSLAPLAGITFSPARGEDAGLAARLAALPAPAGARLVFENGRFRRDLSTGGALPPGAALGSLAEGLAHAPEAIRPHLSRLARPEGLAFTALNAASMGDGAFLLLPAGAVVDAPIELLFAGGAPGHALVHHPRVLVVAGEGARATLAEVYLGGEHVYLTNAVTELVLGDGAVIEHVKLQDEGPHAFHVSSLFAEQGAGSRLAAHSLALGAQLSRAEVRARLLDGHARGVFAGRIRVLPGAQKTDARQMNSNLLLSDDAVVDAKPQLEIFADDVKCGHGGTVGQLDEASLFYLRSRGVAEEEARSLLIWAFAAEMVGRIGPAALRAQGRALVAARLPAGAALLEAA